MRVVGRKQGARFGAVVAMTWIGCGGQASDDARSGIDSDSGRDGGALAEDGGFRTDAPAESAGGHGGAPNDGGSEASESGQAGCGPDPGNIDCDGPCGVGFESPICVGGYWTCEATHDPLQMPCSCLADAWQAFVSHNHNCSESDECTLVAGTGTCGCAPALGNESGDAISTDPEDDRLDDFLQRFEQCKTEGAFKDREVCDAAPAKNLRCENGWCVADSASCLEFDAGDAGASDAGTSD
jgi:hypothetical protein